jgi:RHS repeat-associated protein
MANADARIVYRSVQTITRNNPLDVGVVSYTEEVVAQTNEIYFGNKRYEMVGNTGSVHVVITDRKVVTLTGISADILEVNDFYAWGQEIKSRSWTNESERYLRGYQGMLLENTINGEANMYSTEFRMFDARLGRWMSLDPLMDKFPWMSPFVGFDNNPIFFTDPYGLNTIEKDTKDYSGGGDTGGGDSKPKPKKGNTSKNGNKKPKTTKKGTFQKDLEKRLKSTKKNKILKNTNKAKNECVPNAPVLKGNAPEQKPDKYIVVPGTTKEVENKKENYASLVLAPTLNKGNGKAAPFLLVGLSIVYILENLSEDNAYISDITENPDYSESSTAAPSNPDDFDDEEDGEVKNPTKKTKSVNQLNELVKKGKTPRGIKRFDKGKGTKNLPQDEATFSDNSSLYRDGTWRHNYGHKLTNEQIKFLIENGWKIPK